MIEVFQAFDRTPIAKLESDDTAALDRKFEAATRLFADRRAWLTTSSDASRTLRTSHSLVRFLGYSMSLPKALARRGSTPRTKWHGWPTP